MDLKDLKVLKDLKDLVAHSEKTIYKTLYVGLFIELTT